MPQDAQNTSENRIFVGIPCYNRPKGLGNTIRCLQQQRHTNWKAVISDNASSDIEVARISEDFASRDSRIVYRRNDQNIGAAENFRQVALAATSPYFMWASDDDLWDPEFMASNLAQLQSRPSAQLAASSIDVINTRGQFIYKCPGFSGLTSTENRTEDVIRYLEDPEKQGKASLIYGVFRTSALQSCINECWHTAFSNFYGADFVFMYAFITRNAIVTSDSVHLHKRQPTLATRRIHWRHPRSYRVVPRDEFESYIERHKLVSPTEELAQTAESILRRRQRERFLYLLPLADRILPRRVA